MPVNRRRTSSSLGWPEETSICNPCEAKWWCWTFGPRGVPPCEFQIPVLNSLYDAHQDRDVVILDLATHATVEVTHDRAVDGDPVWSPDGRWLYFTSNRTGITNVYAHDLATGALWQVTPGSVKPTQLHYQLAPDFRVLSASLLRVVRACPDP